jgi:hypothetical protein
MERGERTGVVAGGTPRRDGRWLSTEWEYAERGDPNSALGSSECGGENLVASLALRPRVEDLPRCERREFLDPLFDLAILFWNQ